MVIMKFQSLEDRNNVDRLTMGRRGLFYHVMEKMDEMGRWEARRVARRRRRFRNSIQRRGTIRGWRSEGLRRNESWGRMPYDGEVKMGGWSTGS